jgi:hypothetical protein
MQTLGVGLTMALGIALSSLLAVTLYLLYFRFPISAA